MKRIIAYNRQLITIKENFENAKVFVVIPILLVIIYFTKIINISFSVLLFVSPIFLLGLIFVVIRYAQYMKTKEKAQNLIIQIHYNDGNLQRFKNELIEFYRKNIFHSIKPLVEINKRLTIYIKEHPQPFLTDKVGLIQNLYLRVERLTKDYIYFQISGILLVIFNILFFARYYVDSARQIEITFVLYGTLMIIFFIFMFYLLKIGANVKAIYQNVFEYKELGFESQEFIDYLTSTESILSLYNPNNHSVLYVLVSQFYILPKIITVLKSNQKKFLFVKEKFVL